MADAAITDPEVDQAIHFASYQGLTQGTLGAYARWWQLETWLRELVYVELRARDGIRWAETVKRAVGRQRPDQAFTHMSAADSENPIAYLDYSNLIEIISSNWDLFSYALPVQSSWDGRQPDLTRIRHRLAHMRQPHKDDQKRIEQTLRDLERGAFIAAASYNSRWPLNPNRFIDPITDGWGRGDHRDDDLRQHAEYKYDMTMNVEYSRRPWSPATDTIGSGYLWHVHFIVPEPRIDVLGFWRSPVFRRVRDRLVLLTSPDDHELKLSFSGADDPAETADAIGTALHAVLGSVRSTTRRRPGNVSSRSVEARQTDFRLAVGSGWELVYDDTLPISMFGSGVEVTEAPEW